MAFSNSLWKFLGTKCKQFGSLGCCRYQGLIEIYEVVITVGMDHCVGDVFVKRLVVPSQLLCSLTFAIKSPRHAKNHTRGGDQKSHSHRYLAEPVGVGAVCLGIP